MSLEMELPKDYITAEGPEGLNQALESLLETANQDADFAKNEHYILYKLGNQQSLIKVDTQQQPFHFLYQDLLGRPATKTVKDTIAKFLWEKCGEKERYTRELEARNSQ